MKLSSPPFPEAWSIKDYLGSQKQRVEKRLADLPLTQGKDTQARKAMRYALDSPGKRFRPLMTLATADIYRKGHLDLTLDCGVAIELIHTASLIFDDLPSMDDAGLRRGRPTTHKVFREDQAILAGMCLIAEANLLISQQFNDKKSNIRKKLECVHALNHSYAIEGLSGGQSDDLLNKESLTFEELEYIHARKTGSLFVACTDIACIVSDAPERERRWLNDFSKNLGLAFQIQDDLLDLSESGLTGKDQGKDAGKTTFLTIFGEEKCRNLYNRLIEVALENLKPFGESAAHVVQLTRIIQHRKF